MGTWWTGAVGYEIYPRSFADANDDGIGDLEGIRSRLDYLQWLGVDAIWIAPFYESPGFDHGYDVSNYRAINPVHGTLEDFEALTKDAGKRDIKVIVDIVPNHSSSHHVWFQEALKGPESHFRDYYIWRDPAPDGGPPNNWVSHFGGPAWTLDEASGQYWCHLFLPEQPDLNWTSPEVRREFEEILRFWCERGVDGFRIDVAHGLMKDPELRDNPQLVPIVDPDDPSEVFAAYDHIHDLDQDATIEIYREWNKVVEPYGAVLIGESNPRTLDRVENYVRGDGLHTIFFLEPAWMRWKPRDLLDRLETVSRSAEAGVSWVTDNHDTSRSPTRFGGGDLGRQRSLAVTAFMFALSGFPFLWEGQELALIDADLQPGDMEDPIATRNEHGKGRDGTRTVMPWDSSHANGFNQSETPWLRAPDRTEEETVEYQRAQTNSWLHRHRDLIAVRQSSPDLWESEAEWDDAVGGSARALGRGNTIVVTNLDEAPLAYQLPGECEVLYHSSKPDLEGRRVRSIELEAPATAYLRRI